MAAAAAESEHRSTSEQGRGEVGKFFQARYRVVRLLDAVAILACAAYVDLNQIRAAMELEGT